MRRRELDERCQRAMRRWLESGDERTLAEAYDFGRWALHEGIGLVEMFLALWRAARTVPDGASGGRPEEFMHEALSPFEMALLGAREANLALRRLDARHEEQARRFARELHDEVGQLLATAHLALDSARPHLVPLGAAPLAHAADVLRQAEDEIRRIAHELRPSILDDLGLMPALRFLGEGVAKRTGVAVTVLGAEDRLPGAIETAIFRAAQEALHNVIRHARASRAVVAVERSDEEVCCEVRDDGRGFDPAALSSRRSRRGLGLSGIRERLALLGGRLEISSSPHRGTLLMIHIPLEVPDVAAVAACR